MKNKNTPTAETIIATASEYETLTGNVYKALKELKGFMGKPGYKEVLDVLYTEDPEMEEAAVAVENACMSGEFSCFIQDLTEVAYLWDKE